MAFVVQAICLRAAPVFGADDLIRAFAPADEGMASQVIQLPKQSTGPGSEQYRGRRVVS